MTALLVRRLCFALSVFLSLPSLSLAAEPFDKSTPLNIMPMGDSITMAANPGYRGYLYQMLVDAKYNVHFVGNESSMPTEPKGVTLDPNHQGRGGFSIGPGPSAADAWTGGKGNLYVNMDDWLAPANPKTKDVDLILLLIGINDFANIKDRDPSYDLNTQFTGRLANLCDKILSLRPKATILLCSVLPGGNPDINAVFDIGPFATIDPRLDAEVAKPREPHVMFYDGRNLANTGLHWEPTDWNKGDVIHPNATGDQKLAKFWFAAIEDYLNKYGLPSEPYSLKTPVTATKFSPENGEANADYDRPISIKFSRGIVLSGNLVLKNTSGGPDITVDSSDKKQVSLTADSVQISPTGGLKPATNYKLELQDDQVHDLFGNAVDPINYTFTTKAFSPVLYTENFKNGAVGWNKGADVTMAASEQGFVATGNGQCFYAYTGGTFSGDFTVTAHVHVANAEKAGLLFNTQSPSNGYAVVLARGGPAEFHRITDNVFQFNLNGNKTLVATSTEPFSGQSGSTYLVKVQVHSDTKTMDASVDGQPIFSKQPIPDAVGGSVGFCASYNSQGAGLADIVVERDNP